MFSKKRANLHHLYLFDEILGSYKKSVGLTLENFDNDDNEFIHKFCIKLRTEKMLPDFGYIENMNCWVFEDLEISNPFLVKVKALLNNLGFETREIPNFINIVFLF